MVCIRATAFGNHGFRHALDTVYALVLSIELTNHLGLGSGIPESGNRKSTLEGRVGYLYRQAKPENIYSFALPGTYTG